ncbi:MULTISPECIES: hypothetical protein [unclassified Methanoculleus]|uniref:hypothetical protein n=1 Tax=unclassified Methanoculleus TaxID=2619537 RepID=UPI0025FFC23D|nr:MULTISPECIES: hypothetical protein [unclassified Methanoculleus]MCK9297354.1 hypothetical protein [Methanoculleus sp.]MDD2253382.1 hypothetical protein [Methanoculleus sp.]MDD2788394.1 hypothetical protein [Methanoculleus sp.]MDD3216366.1 hypothetical protein [Methanoculleus sp.]MDD4314350.1 hypothetical protein [Methanoculleus sp.]
MPRWSPGTYRWVPGTYGTAIRAERGSPVALIGAKIYIAELPVWNSTLRGREVNIPGYPYMKVFLEEGEDLQMMKKADYGSRSSVNRKVTAGEEI